MFLSSVALEQFRCFEEARIELPSEGIVLVVGPNNSGKSALLAAIDTVTSGSGERELAWRTGSDTPPVVTATFSLSDLERSALFDDPESLERWPHPWFSTWQLKFSSEIGTNTLYMNEVAVRTGAAAIEYLTVARQLRQSDGMYRIESRNWATIRAGTTAVFDDPLGETVHAGGSPSDFLGALGAFPEVAQLLYEWRAGCYHFGPLRSGAQRSVNVGGVPTLSPTGVDLPQALLTLETNRDPAWAEIVRTISDIVPEVGELATPVDGPHLSIAFIDPTTGDRRNVKDLGTGVEQLLMTAYVGVRRELTHLVMMEEPETNLHPAAQRALLEHLRRWSKNRTFILATHSTVFLTMNLCRAERSWSAEQRDDRGLNKPITTCVGF